MGYFIFGLADVAFFISLIVTVYFGFRSKKNKEAYRDKFNHSIIAAFVFFILLLASSSLGFAGKKTKKVDMICMNCGKQFKFKA